MKTDAVPVFPTGIIGIYKNPNNFSNDFDPTHFKIEKYDGANKFRTGKFVNVLKDNSLELLLFFFHVLLHSHHFFQNL